MTSDQMIAMIIQYIGNDQQLIALIRAAVTNTVQNMSSDQLTNLINQINPPSP